MTPEDESRLAMKLEENARSLHARSSAAAWLGGALWLRFRALLAEETAAGLRRRAERR